MTAAVCYHLDPEINEQVAADTLAAELADLAAGYPPRGWTCECGTSHTRGHLDAIGVHRCLSCGYMGGGGVMWTSDEQPPAVTLEPRAGGAGCAS